MAAPAFRSIASTNYGSRTNLVIAAPAGIVDGDIMILSFIIGAAGVVTPTPPAGFTLIDATSVTDATTFRGDMRAYWKRASGESGSYTVTHAAASSGGSIAAYSGCIASGNPVDVTSKFQSNGTLTTPCPSITTTVNDARLLYMSHGWDGSGAYNSTPPTGFTERYEFLLNLSDMAFPTAGATGVITHTSSASSSDPGAALLIALKPLVAPSGPAFRSIASVDYGSRTNLVIAAPAGMVDGDIMILDFIIGSAAGVAPTPPAGFTLIDATNVVDPGSFHGDMYAYWKRASSESGSYTVTHTTANSGGYITAYSGCVASGSPIDVTSKFQSNSTVSTVCPSITTTVNNTLLAYLSHGWSGIFDKPPPTGFTERYDVLLTVSDKSFPTAGPTGVITQTVSGGSSDPGAAILVALKPVVTGGGGGGALDFPSSPSVGTVYPSPAVSGKPQYTWDGEKWTSGGLGAPVLANDKKNYIINGAMQVSQENGATASGTNTYSIVDQFVTSLSNGGVQSAAQVASPTPAGSPNRIRVTVSTADAAVAASDWTLVYQIIEGFRVADLRSGSAAAKTITVQFGVRAPAGIYCLNFQNGASSRSYVAEYVISALEANVDTIKTVTIALDTAGTWLADNGGGIRLNWTLMAGSTYQTTANVWTPGNLLATANQFNFMGTVGNVFELFDVSLTEGPTAPPFQVPDYLSELALCQRYWEKLETGTLNSRVLGSYVATAGQQSSCAWIFKVRKRAIPAITLSGGIAGTIVDAASPDHVGVTIVANYAIIASGTTANARL